MSQDQPGNHATRSPALPADEPGIKATPKLSEQAARSSGGGLDPSHPLSGLFRDLAASLDGLSGVEEERRTEAIRRLEALHQLAWLASGALDTLALAKRMQIEPHSTSADAIDVAHLVRDLTTHLSDAAGDLGVEFDLNLQVVPGVLADRDLVGRLLESIVGSALLASPSRSRLSINITHSAGEIHTQLVSRNKNSKPTSSATATEVEPARPALSPHDLTSLLREMDPMLEACSGSLQVTSPLGSMFDIRVALPARHPEHGQAEGIILIVDDDPDGAFLLEQVLQKGGFKVRIASNGLEGLTMARQAGVALVLLDVMLPGMDGFEVCHRLRDQLDTKDLPIVMISAKSRPEDREMGLKVGANAYMTKPLGMNDVVQTVTRFMTTIEEGSHDR
jgi:CheY-like chemotaxis protein